MMEKSERTAIRKVAVKLCFGLSFEGIAVAARPEAAVARFYLLGQKRGALSVEQALLTAGK